MREILLLLGVVLTAFSLAGAESLKVDATRRGFLIKSENADITTMTSVIVCVPPFREKHFYNVTDDIDLVNTGDRAAIIQKGAKNKVDIVDYSVTREGDSLILSLVADLTHSDPTDMENTLLVTPEYLLSDADYTAVLADGSEVTGHIPPTFEGEIEVRHVFENAVKASFTNKYGTLTLEVLAGPPFLVGDRRGVVFEERRCFWIGHQVPMFEGKRYDSKVKLTFERAENLSKAKPSASAPDAVVKTTAAADAVIDYNFDYPLYPAPKAMEFYKDKFFMPSDSVSCSIGGNDARLNRAAEKLFRGWGMKLVPSEGDAQLKILISAEGEGIMIPPDNPEGYLLKVDESGIKIYARTEKGAFYALQTLRGLYRDNKFKSALIRDWPDMELRAVHFMLPDRDAYALLSRMITEVMVPMKMNMFIMECEFVHWESIPELHVNWGMTKEDCEKLIALCEENFIEPIPLMQTLSHMPWLFSNGQNLDMCEDTRNPYAYFTSHPDLYPLMEKVFDEVVETFHNPRYLHIGHDELYTWAQYPCRPESIAIGTKKLVYDDVMWYYNYAKKHNAQIMMWHDIFVTPEESPENGHGGGAPDWVDQIRPDLPRDIVFCVWRYAGKTTEFLDLEHLAAEGFEVMGSSWFEINNVERLTLETKRVGGLGMISTTWIYPVLDKNGNIERGCFNALENWFIQVAPYARSGAWSWNSNAKANAGLNGKELFASLLEGSRNNGTMAGELVDLSGIANIGVNNTDKPFLIDELYGFDILKPGKMRVGRVLFDIPAKGDSAGVIALKSRLNPEFPDKVTIKLDNVKCDEFYFLNTALGIQPVPGAVVANYIITYADGEEAVLPVRYQYEVAPPEEDVNYFLSTGNRLNWRFGTQNMSLFYSTFANPRPDVPVTAITVAGTEEEYPFYVFGISLSEKAEQP